MIISKLTFVLLLHFFVRLFPTFLVFLKKELAREYSEHFHDQFIALAAVLCIYPSPNLVLFTNRYLKVLKEVHLILSLDSIMTLVDSLKTFSTIRKETSHFTFSGILSAWPLPALLQLSTSPHLCRLVEPVFLIFFRTETASLAAIFDE